MTAAPGPATGVDAFFVPDGKRFVATPHTQGPWFAGFQHGGPPSALLGRAIEHTVADDPALTVARIAVDLLAPIPLAAFDVSVTVLRAGRKVRRVDATLATGGAAVARATALAVRTTRLDIEPGPTPRRRPEPPERSAPYRLPVALGQPAGYLAAMEARQASATQDGGVAVWMRARVPLLPGEEPSPLQRVLVAADSGNGLAIPADPRRFTFVNADLVVTLHRPLAGEWVCLDAATARGPSGVGLTETRLWDRDGPIGRALQTLVIEPRG